MSCVARSVDPLTAASVSRRRRERAQAVELLDDEIEIGDHVRVSLHSAASSAWPSAMVIGVRSSCEAVRTNASSAERI